MNATDYSRPSRKGHDFDDGSGPILRAAAEVYRELGPGFQEVVYQRALALELQVLGVECAREENVRIYYKGKHIDTRRVDFVVGDIIVETKARAELLDQDKIQTLSYLKASEFPTALLINFGGKNLEVKRLVNDRNRRSFESRPPRPSATAATKASDDGTAVD